MDDSQQEALSEKILEVAKHYQANAMRSAVETLAMCGAVIQYDTATNSTTIKLEGFRPSL